jgi:YfiH family protein
MIAVTHPGGLVTLGFTSLVGSGVEAWVTTRAGGTSTGPYASLDLAHHVGDDPDRVGANRRALCDALGIDRLTVADQQHGTRVARVDEALAGAGHDGDDDARLRLPATDALVTDRPGIALATLVADCAPVVLADPVRRAVAVVHAGRRGVVADLPGAAVRAMRDAFGSDPGDLLAGIGPCIGADHYEIAGSALAQVRAAFGDDLLLPTTEGRATFDLPGAVVRRLVEAGVRPDAVERSGVDTATATDRFFSDRSARPCGRFALVARLAG